MEFKNNHRSVFYHILSLGILLYCSFSYSQQDALYEKAKELVNSEPDEAIKIANYIQKNTENAKSIVHSNLLLGNAYLTKGDYNEAIIRLFNEENTSDEIDTETSIEIKILQAVLLRKLYLYKLSKDFLEIAKKETLSISAKKNKNLFLGRIALEEIIIHSEKRENEIALQLIDRTKLELQPFLEENPTYLIQIFLEKERIFSNLSQNDSATVYMEKTISLVSKTSENNLFTKAEIYKELGHLRLQQKDFQNSEEALSIALRFASIIENKTLLMQINQDLSFNYLAANKKNQYKAYNDEFLLLNNKVEQLEQESINTLFDKLQRLKERETTLEKEKYSKYLNILLFVAFLIFLFGLFIIYKSEGRKKRLNEIINYLEISYNFLQTKNKPKKEQRSKGIVISEETEQIILNKLNKFEKSKKFLNKDMSLAVLAGQFETNTKYLSEVINKNYNDHFNTFINKLRINYIIEKLQNDPNYIHYKISFLAEECGFSSHSSFTTVFKSIVGMSPATFIDLIREERENNLSKKEENK